MLQRWLWRSSRSPWPSLMRLHSTATSATNEFISQTLLNRARAMATEHDKLNDQLSASYDMKIAKRAGELNAVTLALKTWEDAHNSLEELNALLNDPQTDSELRTLATEDISSARDALTQASSSLTTALVPVHPFAALPCLLEIRPGAGGSEAALFAGDLLRMYRAYCSRLGLGVSLLKYEDEAGVSDPNGSDSPLQEAVLEINNEGAYGQLRCEAGVHRVQRVPATESKGRTHTSAVSVMVLPSLPESGAMNEDLNDPNSDYYVDPSEVRTDVMKAGGAGGQHVNKTESAIRLTHIPTNTVVSMQDTRSQHQNRQRAWQLLRARLAQRRRQEREEEVMNLRRSVVGVGKMDRADKVRTYNYGQQRVTDHRSGFSVHDLDDVMDGGPKLEDVMESVRKRMMELEVEALVAEQ